MSKRVIAVLVGTLLALVAATVWVPWVENHRFFERGQPPGERPPWGHPAYGDPSTIRYGWAWDSPIQKRSLRSSIGVEWRGELQWPLLLSEQALILLIGGSLLTWAIRRNRRRAEATG